MGVHESQTDNEPQTNSAAHHSHTAPQQPRHILQVCLHVGAIFLTPIFAVVCFLAFIRAPDNAARLPGDLLVVTIVLYAIQLGATPQMLAYFRPQRRYLLGLGLGLTPFIFTAGTVLLLFFAFHLKTPGTQSMETFPLFIGMAFYLLQIGATIFYLLKKQLRPVAYGMLTAFLCLPILVYIIVSVFPE